MRWFTGHKIIKDGEDYVVELYIDRHLTEFAREFNEIYVLKNKSLKNSMIDYIKEKLPNQKVSRINIMLGSLPVASLYLGSAETTSHSVEV